MGKIWLLILLSSISVLMFKDPDLVVKSMLAGSDSALRLALQLIAMYGFWLGFFAILEHTGVSKIIAKLLSPLIRFLFRGSTPEAQKYIAMNMSANLLGLGNAATPMGISAVKALETEGDVANSNVIMLVVISATSLQLLPTTVISLRASHGSQNPADFLLPCIIATILSTIIGVVLVKAISKILKRKKSAAKTLPLNEALCRNT